MNKYLWLLPFLCITHSVIAMELADHTEAPRAEQQPKGISSTLVAPPTLLAAIAVTASPAPGELPLINPGPEIGLDGLRRALARGQVCIRADDVEQSPFTPDHVHVPGLLTPLGQGSTSTLSTPSSASINELREALAAQQVRVSELRGTIHKLKERLDAQEKIAAHFQKTRDDKSCAIGCAICTGSVALLFSVGAVITALVRLNLI